MSWYSYSKLARNKGKNQTVNMKYSSSTSHGKISVIIPIKNEAQYIGKTIRNIEVSTYDKSKVEIILVDSGSKDNYMDVAKASAGLVPLIFTKQLTNYGKGHSYNVGFEVASGDILLLIHADSMVPLGYDETLRRELKDPSVLMAYFKFGYENPTSKFYNSHALRIKAIYENLRTSLCFLPTASQGLGILSSRFMTRKFNKDSIIFDEYNFVMKMRQEMIDGMGTMISLDQCVYNSYDEVITTGPLKHTLFHHIAFILYYFFNVSEVNIIKWIYIKCNYFLKWIHV
jgi:glycosyltransferase involved in cell wall biosynthesis